MVKRNYRYQAGYRFEKRVHKHLAELLDKMPEIKYYIIESRGSKGKADLVVGLFNSLDGSRFWFGVQCKKGYISKPEIRRGVYLGMKEHGMFLYHATLDKDKKIVITPELGNFTASDIGGFEGTE